LAGERRIGKADGVLSILGLGSCVAVILYDDTTKLGGLAHILLPDPSFSSYPERRWRFAATAIPALLGELESAGANRNGITARLVGGARMFQDLMPPDRIHLGERNVAAARAALARDRVEIVAEDVGGENGRSLHFNLEDGRVRITRRGTDHVEI
jgi:chemotaxis protein CheD